MNSNATFAQHRDSTELVRPFFSQVLEWRDHEEEIIQRDASNLMELLGGNLVELMGDRFTDVIDECVENPTFHKIRTSANTRQYVRTTVVTSQTDLVTDQLQNCFKHDSKSFEGKVNQLVSACLDSAEGSTLSSSITFIWDISQVMPKVSKWLLLICVMHVLHLFSCNNFQEFSAASIALLVETLQNPESHGFGLMSLSCIAPVKLDDVMKHDDAICASMKKFPSMAFYALKTLVPMALKGKV